MIGGLNYTTWQPEKPYSTNISLNMNDTQTKENSFRRHISLTNIFWTFVAVVNVLIIADVLLNSGGILINVLYELTGGYKG